MTCRRWRWGLWLQRPAQASSRQHSGWSSMRASPDAAVFPTFGISAMASSIFWEKGCFWVCGASDFLGRPDSEHYSFQYLVPSLQWEISQQRESLSGQCNRQLLFMCTSWMHVHDGWFMWSVCLCCALCDKVCGVVCKDWGHWSPTVLGVNSSSSTYVLRGLGWVTLCPWPSLTPQGSWRIKWGQARRIADWHIVEVHWMVAGITISGVICIPEPFLYVWGSCSALSLVKCGSKERFCGLFTVESHLVACNLVWIISLHKGGQVLNQLMQSRRHSWHCPAMDWA